MSYTITAEDNDFGAATGSNIGAGGSVSYFDDPPSDLTDLVITADPSDMSPSVFSLGDTYDLSYTDQANGTSHTIEDAFVVRSDPLTGGGAVVFRGIDQNFQLVELVWAPNIDLQAWYDNAVAQGAQPGFYNSDQNVFSDYEHSFVCFSSDTRLTTPRGEVAAGDLSIGDLVLTLDRGFQPILWVGRRVVQIDQKRPGAQPVLIQPNAFPRGGLCHRVIVSPQHRLLLHDASGAEMLAPAKAFVGLKGIRHMRGRSQIEYVSVMLDQHDVLDASGLAAESFLPGPQGYKLLSVQEIREVDAVLETRGPDRSFPPARPCLGGSSGQRALKAGGRPVAFPRLRLVPDQAAGHRG